MRKAYQIILPLGLFVVLSLTRCTFDQIPPKPVFVPPPVDTIPGETISFNSDIIPIFEAKCNAVTCHGGSWAPNLEPANAYNELVVNPSKNWVDTLAPEQSLLYKSITGNESMAQYANDDDRTDIYTWIAEGAKNN